MAGGSVPYIIRATRFTRRRPCFPPDGPLDASLGLLACTLHLQSPLCVCRCASRQVLQEHGKQLNAVLRAWDSESSEVASREAFRQAAQAVGALGLASRIPSTVELDSMFEAIAAGKETIAIAQLLKQPFEPRTFEVEVFEVDEDFDPDDCFEDFGSTCMACNALVGKHESLKLLACQRCKRVRYCGRACQLAGWRRGHKESCGKHLPRPSKITNGSPQYVLSVLREFHAANGGLSFACLSRLAAFALDPNDHKKVCQAPIPHRVPRAACRPSAERVPIPCTLYPVPHAVPPSP